MGALIHPSEVSARLCVRYRNIEAKFCPFFLYELTLVKYVVCGSEKEMFYTKDLPKHYRL